MENSIAKNGCKIKAHLGDIPSDYSERKNSGIHAGDEANVERGKENHGLQAVGIYSVIASPERIEGRGNLK